MGGRREVEIGASPRAAGPIDVRRPVLAVLGLGTLAVGALGPAAAWQPGRWAGQAHDPGAALSVLTAWLAAAVLARCWLAALLAALSRLPGRLGALAGGAAERITPRLLRTLAQVGLSATLLAALPPGAASGLPAAATLPATGPATGPVGGPVAGAPPGPGREQPAFWRPAPAPAPVLARSGASGASPSWWAVDRPAPPDPATGAPAPDRATPTPAAPTPAATVTVAPGDCLWSLAARSLGPGAPAARVAARWPAWWRANAAVIGPDPALLLPGEVLRVPGADS